MAISRSGKPQRAQQAPDLLHGLCADSAAATFSPCRTYRYTLSRTWDPARPVWVFAMLNPSTADEFMNDPTVARCQKRAMRGGAGGVVVVNIFAYRSTDPSALYGLDDPVGPGNDDAILDKCRSAGMVICAWGKHGALHDRGAGVKAMLEAAGVTPHVLALNKDGSPKHPLYVGNDVQPFLWT